MQSMASRDTVSNGFCKHCSIINLYKTLTSVLSHRRGGTLGVRVRMGAKGANGGMERGCKGGVAQGCRSTSFFLNLFFNLCAFKLQVHFTIDCFLRVQSECRVDS